MSRMKRIKSITIKNFQKHKNIKVDLGKTVTTIVGQTDSGKSSILRALGWVLFNQPSGKSFIRSGETSCSVSLQTGGKQITRKRTKTKNTYQIDDQEYAAVGSSVPEPVENLLRVNANNFQGQHDTPFWFSDSAGQVSKNLNQIINLGIIDEVLGRAGSLVRETNTRLKASQERESEYKEEEEKKRWAKKAMKKVQQLEQLQKKQEKNQAALDLFLSLQENAEKLQKQCDAAKREQDKVGECLQKVEEYQKESAGLSLLNKLAHDHERLQEVLCQKENELTKNQNSVKKAMKKRCPTCKQKLILTAK